MEADTEIYTILVTTGIVLLLVAFIVIYIFQQLRKQQQHRLEKQVMQARYTQELLTTQLEIQEQTFINISQEIHDNIGQVLSLAKLNLNTLNGFPNEAMQRKADTTKELVSKAITDLRDLSRSLHGDKLAQVGLHEAIADQLRILQNSGQFETALTETGNPVVLSAQRQTILFRMVQELLNNAVKHAKAARLTVALDYNPLLTLTVTDNGVGFNPGQLQATQTGIGLTNIYSRAALINANIAVLSSPGSGTSIAISLLD